MEDEKKMDAECEIDSKTVEKSNLEFEETINEDDSFNINSNQIQILINAPTDYEEESKFSGILLDQQNTTTLKSKKIGIIFLLILR